MTDKNRIVIARRHLQEGFGEFDQSQGLWLRTMSGLFDDLVASPDTVNIARRVMVDLLFKYKGIAAQCGGYRDIFRNIPHQVITPMIRGLALLLPAPVEILDAFGESVISPRTSERMYERDLLVLAALLEVDDWSVTYPGLGESEKRNYTEALYKELKWIINNRFLRKSSVSKEGRSAFSTAMAKYVGKAKTSELRHQEVIALSDVLRTKFFEAGFFGPEDITAEEVFVEEFLFKVLGRGYQIEQAIGMLAADLQEHPKHLICPPSKPATVGEGVSKVESPGTVS